MWNIKSLLKTKMILFTLIILLSSFNTFQMLSIEKSDESENTRLSDKSMSFIDLNDEEVIKEQLRKIAHFKSIEGQVIRHLDPKEIEDELNQNLRSLATTNDFDDVALVDPNLEPYSKIQRWIMRSIKQYSSKIVVYPYAFDYKNFTENIHFPQGAFISLKPEEVEDLAMGLRTDHTIHVNKARALFDADIAILNIKADFLQKDTELFYDAIDWCTYFQTYLGKGTCQRNYQNFLKQKYRSQDSKLNTFVTWVNETEVGKGVLMNEGLPRFGILIVPDYITGSDDIIKSKLNKEGISKIIEFYENGGIIFITGKSGTLFEDFGLIAKGTYNRNYLLSINTRETKVSTSGCEARFNKTYSKTVDDFKEQMICLSIKKANKVGLSTTFLTQKLPTDFKNILNIDTDKDLIIRDVGTGEMSVLNEEQNKTLPLISHKSNDKNGQLFLMNFNAMLKGGDRNIILNLLSLALSKELYLFSNVTMNINSTEMPDMPIPAGEAGFNLEVNTVFHNLNDKDITNCVLYVFLPDNFNWTVVPNTCQKKLNVDELPISVKQQKTFNSSNEYLLCKLGTVTTYEKKVFSITISVLNYKATQMKYNVLILEPIVIFTDSQKKENTLVDFVKVNCEAAALLRVAINPDPSSFYPVKGEGQYIDNVVKIENKEQSTAYDVEYVGLIPLISPLTDGDDQRKTQWNLKIYVDYYNTLNTFEVPFRKDDAQDFVYTAYLRGKGAVIVAEWDSPVQPVKEIIDPDKFKEGINLDEGSDLAGINFGMLTINKTSEILKQINFRKSDRFYKLASQRLMIFIDDSTPQGYKTLYKNGDAPQEWSFNGDRAKREFIFTRQDIYFYENENYVNPPKISEKIVFSLDKYKKYAKNQNGCVNERGEARSKIIEKGYFDNFDAQKRVKILEPNIFSNELFEYCDLTVIDPTSVDEIKKQFGDTNNLRPVHYIIPNVEPSITRPNHIYNFKETDQYSGYHNEYNSIKFLYLHTYDLTIINTTCLYGGKIIINLGDYTISQIEDVTIAPDQIAVFKIVNQNKQIIAYFRRGLMSNEQFGKNLNIKINIENLQLNKAKVRDAVNLKVDIQEMTYDISYQPDYEKYKNINSQTCKFEYKTAWSYPALEIKAKLNRTLNGYETLEPFSRYGVYIQELKHRTVYSTAETHFESKPGIVGNGASFSMISNLGISSIPFIEYLTVGRGQVIPAGTSTSRATWKDVWGRVWHQPLRSVFPDVPPLPGPLKNFMMTTTYEILQNGKQIYEWPSDENAQIHLHIKLLNNYQKFFEITRCQKNQIRFVPQNLGEKHDLYFYPQCPVELQDKDFQIKSKVYCRQGGYASYGACFTEKGAIVGGEKVEGEFLKKIERAKVCADFTNAQDIKQCEEELKDITTLHRVNSASTVRGKNWNYSPTIESYYPTGYIEDDMWDLTHVDYDDSNMVKAHPYHMDNHLPNYDNTIIKPHNTIAVPIYKGLGYSITYSKTNTMNYHGVTKKGWWGDNLQNKDDTLLAGQNTCNTISVDKKNSINFVNGAELQGNNSTRTADVKKIIEERNKNIYVCLYNRKRPDFGVNTNKKYYAGNVNENNIVPIIVDLDKNDPRLTNFNCTGNQYTPDNLYELEGNYLETPTSKDYLYFAANLRGQAKESFNVLMNLNYFDKVKFEGMIKVNEGGRFVYWNPANGPNSFLVVDDPVSIVNAKRNDIELSNNLFPSRVATFNSTVYHTYTFKDDNKKNKVWPFYEFYANSYGFGDVSVSVYVGGIRRSKAVLQPGKTTYAKIIFYNNCGFDWNMKGNAIDFEYIKSKPISANDLLNRIVHSIQVPLEYNFLKYSVEGDYKKYIKIKPSDHNIEVAPEFFDFENINVVTIRDGFKGEYNLQINVTDDFPDDLRGKPIEIKLELDPSYFDKFPGTDTDPIKSFHKYTVKVPSIYIAVPYKTGKYAGKVLYTSAQASNLDLSFYIGIDWNIDGVKYISEENLNKMTNATQYLNDKKEMEKIWNELGNNLISFTEEIIDDETKKVTIDGIKKDYPLFPKKVKGAPDIAEVKILIKSSVHQLQYGTSEPIRNVKLVYNKWNGGQKVAEGDKPFIYASGAWINIKYSRLIGDLYPNGTFIDSKVTEISHEDEGFMKISFTLENIGNGNSYYTKYQIFLQEKIKYVSCISLIDQISAVNNPEGGSTITFDLKAPINVGERVGGYIFVEFFKYINSYSNYTPEELKQLPTQLKVSKQSAAILDLTENKGENEMTQYLRVPLYVNYKVPDKTLIYMDLVVSGARSNPTITINPKINYKKDDNINNIKLEVIKFDYTQYGNKNVNLRRLDEDFEAIYPLNTFADNIEDKPNVKDTSNKEHYVLYKVILTRNDKTTTYNRVYYDQKEIGITLIEIILIILSAAFFTLSLVFFCLAFKNLRSIKKTDPETEINTGKIDRLIEDE